jgi:hypothetical protein
MDLKIRRVSESDFDSIVRDAGGSRIREIGSADYSFDDAILELKLVEEEGLDKKSRQQKLARLFRDQQPLAPVVVIAPKSLDSVNTRNYYNIVAGPIKTHVKKAADQLDKTVQRRKRENLRVLVIINVGYTALSLDEFQDVCVRSVQNDTSKIDWVVCGGVYFYSDTFDHYLIAPLKGVPINLATGFPGLDRLQKSWGNLVEKFLTDAMFGQVEGWTRRSVVDLIFDLDGVRYIKPAPKFPASKYWPGGRRPRDNSSGIEECPPVGLVFPRFDERTWQRFKKALPTCKTLKESYPKWIAFGRDEEAKSGRETRPFVFVNVDYGSFVAAQTDRQSDWDFSNICEHAANEFNVMVRRLLEQASDADEANILPPEYIFVVSREIGQDKANDLSSIYHVWTLAGRDHVDPISQDQRLFLEHALSIGGAYAIKRDTPFIRFRRIPVEGE